MPASTSGSITTTPCTNVPEGVELADAADILPLTGFLRHERTGSPALHSDLFRYHMLAKLDRTIWADTDAYCVKPFATPTGHFHAWESETGINGGVLGLPRDSETLAGLLDFTATNSRSRCGMTEAYRAELSAARRGRQAGACLASSPGASGGRMR